VRRPSLAGLPAVGSPPDLLDFAVNVGDYIDTGNIETVDPTTNRIFVQVHNRSLNSIASGDIRVLLLITDAALGLPALPAGYAANIVAGNNPNRPSGWLAGSQWWAGDATSPYRVVNSELTARMSRVVDFNVDLSPLALPATHEHICAAAFATTISALDQLTSTESSLDILTMHDRHAAHRNLHVVPVGSMPAAEGDVSSSPQTFLLDLHNPLRRAGTYEIVFHRNAFEGQLSMLLSAVSRAAKFQLRDWKVIATEKLPPVERRHWRRWLKAVQAKAKEFGQPVTKFGKQRWADVDPRIHRLRKLAALVPDRCYSLGESEAPSFRITLNARETVTAAFTWRPPRQAKVGDTYRLDIVQQLNDRQRN
jgi:hypothetical protein